MYCVEKKCHNNISDTEQTPPSSSIPNHGDATTTLESEEFEDANYHGVLGSDDSDMEVVGDRGEHRAGSVGFGPKMVHPEKTESIKSWFITDHFKFWFCRFKWVTVGRFSLFELAH
jgi:hypothetical protein